MSETLKDRLIRTEGKRSKLYRDTSGQIGFEGKPGKVSIGIGYNIDDNGLPDDIIYMLLDRSIQKATNDLNRYLPWTATLDWPRKSVLIDMIFNMGIGTVLKFHLTLDHIKHGEYREAAKEMRNSLWYRQVKIRAENLCRIMETGEI